MVLRPAGVVSEPDVADGLEAASRPVSANTYAVPPADTGRPSRLPEWQLTSDRTRTGGV